MGILCFIKSRCVILWIFIIIIILIIYALTDSLSSIATVILLGVSTVILMALQLNNSVIEFCEKDMYPKCKAIVTKHATAMEPPVSSNPTRVSV